MTPTTSEITTPSWLLSAIIARFSSSDHSRRRSTPVLTSIRYRRGLGFDLKVNIRVETIAAHQPGQPAPPFPPRVPP
jgi:hypothetical protein